MAAFFQQGMGSWGPHLWSLRSFSALCWCSGGESLAGTVEGHVLGEARAPEGLQLLLKGNRDRIGPVGECVYLPRQAQLPQLSFPKPSQDHLYPHPGCKGTIALQDRSTLPLMTPASIPIFQIQWSAW